MRLLPWWYMAGKCDNKEEYLNWAHMFPRVWRYKKGCDITECDITKVKVYVNILYSWSKWRFSCLLNSHIFDLLQLHQILNLKFLSFSKHAVQSLLNTHLLTSVLETTPNHMPLKYKCPIKISNEIRHVYLNVRSNHELRLPRNPVQYPPSFLWTVQMAPPDYFLDSLEATRKLPRRGRKVLFIMKAVYRHCIVPKQQLNMCLDTLQEAVCRHPLESLVSDVALQGCCSSSKVSL